MSTENISFKEFFVPVAIVIQDHMIYLTKQVRAHEWKPNFWMILLMIVDAVIVLFWLLAYEPELIPRDASGNQLNKSLSLVRY